MTQQSTAELVRQASEQISALVRDELRQAKAELADKGRHAGLGIGMWQRRRRRRHVTAPTSNR